MSVSVVLKLLLLQTSLNVVGTSVRVEIPSVASEVKLF